MPDKKAIKKIEKRLELLSKYGVGFLTKSGTMKKLHGFEIYEIKIDFNNVFYRILCVVRGSVCWLLNMFTKKSDKTPYKEIKTTLERVRNLDISLSYAMS